MRSGHKVSMSALGILVALLVGLLVWFASGSLLLAIVIGLVVGLLVGGFGLYRGRSVPPV